MTRYRLNLMLSFAAGGGLAAVWALVDHALAVIILAKIVLLIILRDRLYERVR